MARGGALRVQPWSARARLAGNPGLRQAPLPKSLPMPKPVPDIANGIAPPSAIRDAATASRDPLSPERLLAESAALPSIAAGLPPLSLLGLGAPAPFCSTDETRIANYAGRIAGSVGLKPGDDLALFSAEGLPAPNLAPVLLAMSNVELGTLRAGADLVAAAIARRIAP